MPQRRRIATLDLETDPFEYGKVPQPFLSGFYDGRVFCSIWDDTRCITRTVESLAAIKDPLIIYAHNGGKFDWFYFMDHLSNQSRMRIINGRIVQAYIGLHEIRDSFAIMPFALAKYRKGDIDYSKLSRADRDRHRDEIIDYLRTDCVALHELVTAFWDEFGDALTVGSAGLRELKKFHKFSCGRPDFDDRIRTSYYYGGRVQVFSRGIVAGPVEVLDVNSMYPYVMQSRPHPIGVMIEVSRRIMSNTCFVTAEGISHGAFAVRAPSGGIDFPWGSGVYHTTIHEWNAAEQCGLFKCKRILKTYGFNDRTCFDTFVNHFYQAKVSAKLADDKIHELFYKYVLNSTYGKFAQNPENFSDYAITRLGDIMPDACDCSNCHHNLDSSHCTCMGWHIFQIDQQKYMLWSKPVKTLRYYNIATAASITGAARAELMLGMNAAESVHYCDTDSIFVRSHGRLPISGENLGEWKVEATADLAAFCGKKLYALFDASGACIKKAHKGIPGARPGLQGISGSEIRTIAAGEIPYLQTYNDVPHFKLSGLHGFVKRKVRMT